MEQNKIKSTAVKEINRDNNENEENQIQENEQEMQEPEPEPEQIGDDYSEENEY